MASSLYERLGGRTRIAAVMEDVVALHLQSPIVGPRFKAVKDLDQLKKHAIDFVCAGTGGPEAYTGRDMRTTHTGMNVSEQEFVAVVDDILAALDKNGVHSWAG